VIRLISWHKKKTVVLLCERVVRVTSQETKGMSEIEHDEVEADRMNKRSFDRL
jgi:hypothetical protein